MPCSRSPGGSPGPHPMGKWRGIWSRPTAKGEIEGDLVQAHSQGGSWGLGSWGDMVQAHSQGDSWGDMVQGVPCPGGVPGPGGPGPSGVFLVPGGAWSQGGACSRGLPAPGGACSGGGCLVETPWWLLLWVVHILLECFLVHVTGSNFKITFVNNTSSSTMCFSDTNHLVVKVTAKYWISLYFRPSIMEFPTRHLVLCNRIYLSGCSQFKQVGTRSNQLDLVPVRLI